MPFLTDRIHELNESRHQSVSAAHGFDPAKLTERLGGSILGQTKAVDAVVRALTLSWAGLTDPNRPLANLLFVGPTGVGKTELVRCIAAEVRSGPDDMCRIDMNALAQEHYAASLSGAPPGYSGSKESHSLFDRSTIEGDLYRPGIVLFDEIEKADPTVLKALLQILDHGELRLANGQQRISFRNSFVFLTSNLGTKDVAQHQKKRRLLAPLRGASSGHSAVIVEALERFFDPEFFNRIDETVVFDALSPQSARAVTNREITLLATRLARRSVTLYVDESVTRLLIERGFDPVYGARGLKRAIRIHINEPIAQKLLEVRHRSGVPLALQVGASSHGVEVTVEHTAQPLGEVAG
ncbi:AAA family ATPase [Mycolicibacterium smegmatis]|uniref:AAA family ATPase n=1 Tax=Mycolicibacterium smegmatis TaxID=1772 RepID=UPI001303C77D|nr:AAA family ATPase [Mycolicibacterium smegmatis]